MNFKHLVSTLGFVLAIAASSLAHAQASRTWVSGVGDDVNPCSRTAPCKTFAGAIGKTAPGGVINVLDPGGFGGVTINKAMTIDGGYAGIASVLTNGTSGIIVNAGATDLVVLRNLQIDGQQLATSSTAGVLYMAGGALVVENVAIQRHGIGIDIPSSLVAAHLDVRNVSVTGATFGLRNASPGGRIMVSDSVLRTNGTGINSQGGDLALHRSSLIGITTGIVKSGSAQIYSYQDNVFFGNTSDGNKPKNQSLD